MKTQVDLRQIVEQDLGPAPTRSSRASLWKCPFHGERNGYSLVVWADGYRCFGKCQIVGDALDWLQRYRHLSFGEAVQVLGGSMGSSPTISARRSDPPETTPPPESWQVAAWQVVLQAEEQLWQAPGEWALNYLLNERGLEPRTIREARLGVVTGGHRRWRTIAGLQVPCGITIPWITDETLWAVKVRRFGGPKYTQIAGGTGGLYRGDQVQGAKAVLFTEGEFDALIAHQEAEPLVAAVSLGSASNTLNHRWLADLVRVPLILAAYDVDRAGTKGAARLQALSRRVHVIRVPEGKDITEYHRLGHSVYGWLANELRQVRQQAISQQLRGEK